LVSKKEGTESIILPLSVFTKFHCLVLSVQPEISVTSVDLRLSYHTMAEHSMSHHSPFG
jgi:hypothetical protein